MRLTHAKRFLLAITVGQVQLEQGMSEHVVKHFKEDAIHSRFKEKIARAHERHNLQEELRIVEQAYEKLRESMSDEQRTTFLERICTLQEQVRK